jgi:hypothetical protein
MQAQPEDRFEAIFKRQPESPHDCTSIAQTGRKAKSSKTTGPMWRAVIALKDRAWSPKIR